MAGGPIVVPDGDERRRHVPADRLCKWTAGDEGAAFRRTLDLGRFPLGRVEQRPRRGIAERDYVPSIRHTKSRALSSGQLPFRPCRSSPTCRARK